MSRLAFQDMEVLTQDKINSPRTVDRLVADELLEMGFSYKHTGTHYLHDSIVYSTSLKLEEYQSVNKLCQRVSVMVCKKYNIETYHYGRGVSEAIMRAFDTGNINYLLEVFKGSYNKDTMTVKKNAFIMTVRRKIMEKIETQDNTNPERLKEKIKLNIEKITDYVLLKSIYDIILCFEVYN